MSYKSCKKCNVKFRVIQLVCCKNCNGYFDRKCAKELCDEAGEWAIPPTKLVKWSCTECQTQPALLCCDVCSRRLSAAGAFAACGACGRHVCRACAGAPARRPRRPWLCAHCCESPRDVPASWNNDKIFAAAYVRFPTLWNPNATAAELEHARASLGAALGLAAGAQLLERCLEFAHKYKIILRRLSYRYRTPVEILRHAPGWVRETEQRLNWLPSIMQSVWLPKEPEEILVELARRMRSAAPAPRRWPAQVLRVVAARLACPEPALKDVWSQAVRVALLKLQTLALLGDAEAAPAARLRPHEWLAADAALLLSDKRAEWLVGYLNSQVWLLHALLRLVQQFQLEKKCSPSNGVRSARARWISAYKQYTQSGLKSSVIVLQRRWWELKIETHINMRMRARGVTNCAILPHHVLIARRYPHVVTRRILPWGQLRKKNLIVDVTEEQVQEFKDYVTPLPVADDDLILQEANNLIANDDSTNDIITNRPTIKQENNSPKKQQVVAQLRRDVKELINLDQMQNLNLAPLIQNYEDDLSQLSGVNNNLKPVDDNLSALKEVDPKIASTNIIFESDSDVEIEDDNKSLKSNEETDSADNCQIVECRTETCVLSDESDMVFKSKKSNIGVCIATSNETKVKDGNDLEIIETEPNVKESVDPATDPKLRMVPIVPLVRVDDQQITGSKKPQEIRIACKDAIMALKEALIGYQKPDEVEASKNRGIEDKLVETRRYSVSSKISEDIKVTCKDTIMALRKDLIGYKITDEDASGKDSESAVGSDLLPVKKLERPWGYKGPLTGRVEDLSWLCTSVSVTIEKLPEDILNNVREAGVGGVAGVCGAGPGSRRVSLPDIEQVRRHNRRLLVAQVAPLHHDTAAGDATPQRHSRAQSFESSITSKSSSPSLEDYGLLTQPPDDANFTDPISEAQLQTVLDNITPTSAAAHCCVARRHRAYNDARRRHAARAGRADAYAEYDLHGARCGRGAAGGACGCCCRRALGAAPPSLAALQRELHRSLDALLRKRCETSSDKTQSDNSDHLKRAARAQSSSEDERLVIDVPQPKKPKKPNKKKKRRKTKVASNKRTADVREPETNQKKQKTKDTNDEIDDERRKIEDYNEWMRQKNSHRRFFEPPGTKDNTIIYLSKKQDQVLTKIEYTVLRPDWQDHTYANQTMSKTGFAKVTETVGSNVNQLEPTSDQRTQPTSEGPPNRNPPHITSNVASTVTSLAIDTRQHQHSRTVPQEKLTCVTLTKEHSNSKTTQQVNLRLTSGNLISRVTSEPAKSVGTASLPVSQQSELDPVQSPSVLVSPLVVNQATLPHPAKPSSFVTFDNHQPTSYFMIYQPPTAPTTDQPLAIVPMALSIPTEDATKSTSYEPSKDKKSIFQENFRQKMVQNLSLLSGGELLSENDIQNQLELKSWPSLDDSKTTSPKIFDEFPKNSGMSPSNVMDESPFSFPLVSVPSLPTCGLPTMESTLPLISNNLQIFSNSLPTMPTNFPIISTSLPIMPTHLPIMSTALPTISTNIPILSTSLPTMPTNLPTMSTSLPTLPINLPVMSTSISTIPTNIPILSTSLPTMPTNLSTMSTSLTTLPINLPVMSTSISIMPTNMPVVATSLPIVADGLPGVAPDFMPTITSVTSLAPDALSDEDDCVITSPPAPKTVITPTSVTEYKSTAARFISPASLYREVPEHVSVFLRGRGAAPFGLLRLDAGRRAWALPGGELVLTDAAVACGNAKYFIINSKSLKRMVPVHFDRPEPAAPGRIRVRAFAKMADAAAGPGGARTDEMISADNRLFKRLADDPPIYAKVLTALTDVSAAEALVARGGALLAYCPCADALACVRVCARARACVRAGRELRCARAGVAEHIASNFNYISTDPTWKAAPPSDS